MQCFILRILLQNSNVLSAVLLLLDNMDEEHLRIVQKEVDQKLGTMEGGNHEPESDKKVEDELT